MPTLLSLTTWLRAHAARLLIAALVLGVSLLVLPRLEPDALTSSRLTTQHLMRTQHGALHDLYTTWQAARPEELPPPARLLITYSGPEGGDALLLQRFAAHKDLPPVTSSPSPGAPHMHLLVTPHKDGFATLIATLTLDHTAIAPPLHATTRHGSWPSLLPPLLAVLLALTFRRLLFSLGSAVWLGAALQVHFNPWLATKKTVLDYLWPNLTDPFNLHVIGFTISLVGMVHIILKMGGMEGLLDRLKRFAHSARSTRMTTALMGGALFFDDYANTIVVGSTMRPMSDSFRISREKLAYLVDSTSAPIAGLAIISTWIGYEVGLFDDLSRTLGLGQSGYSIFFDILSLRFYCLLTLAFVLMNAWSGRDFGPMRRAEDRAWLTGELLPEGATLLKHTDPTHIAPKEAIAHRWYNAAIPVCAVIAFTFVGMLWSGWRGPQGTQIPGLLAMDGDTFALWRDMLAELGASSTWRDAFSHADNARVLFWSAILASAVAATLALTQRLLTPREVVTAWLRAIPAMGLAIAILLLAWSIRAVCDDLNTSVFLVGAVEGVISLMWLPVITFLLAAVVAFSTGTSWGTMGILLPAMIPLVHALTQQPGAHDSPHTVLLLCFAAVLDGAIFGDHCSPISDTTVMSSLATECDHVEHVRTQGPYALVTMSCAAIFGYLGVALGLSPWLALLAGALSIAAILALFGKPRPDS